MNYRRFMHFVLIWLIWLRRADIFLGLQRGSALWTEATPAAGEATSGYSSGHGRDASRMRALMFCSFRRVQKSTSYTEFSSVFVKKPEAVRKRSSTRGRGVVRREDSLHRLLYVAGRSPRVRWDVLGNKPNHKKEKNHIYV